MAVAGWLSSDARPLDTPLGWRVARVEGFSDGAGHLLYYIVFLD